MVVVAIDPGTANTGLVLMDECTVYEAETVHIAGKVADDQAALSERCARIWERVSAFLDHQHDAVVIEGFIAFTGRQGGYTYHTPFLVGYLVSKLDGERVIIQTSRQVLNARTPGNVAYLKRWLTEGRGLGGSWMLTNDHLRSAACHGFYYLKGVRDERG